MFMDIWWGVSITAVTQTCQLPRLRPPCKPLHRGVSSHPSCSGSNVCDRYPVGRGPGGAWQTALRGGSHPRLTKRDAPYKSRNLFTWNQSWHEMNAAPSVKTSLQWIKWRRLPPHWNWNITIQRCVYQQSINCKWGYHYPSLPTTAARVLLQ